MFSKSNIGILLNTKEFENITENINNGINQLSK